MIRIAIANQQRHLKINRQRLRAAVRRVFRGEGITDAEISIACVDDATIQRLNERFLKHHGPTDVITFPLSEPGVAMLGEIVLSVETAKRIAAELGHAVEREVLLYVIHGVLHLCGYEDHAARDRKRMREREAHYLREACG